MNVFVTMDIIMIMHLIVVRFVINLAQIVIYLQLHALTAMTISTFQTITVSAIKDTSLTQSKENCVYNVMITVILVIIQLLNVPVVLKILL